MLPNVNLNTNRLLIIEPLQIYDMGRTYVIRSLWGFNPGYCFLQTHQPCVVTQPYFTHTRFVNRYSACMPDSIPGFLFGKRILFFLSLMCVVGIINHLMLTYGASDYKEYIQTITKAASTLLLLPWTVPGRFNCSWNSSANTSVQINSFG